MTVSDPQPEQQNRSEPSSTELELYRLAVEMADRVSARRGTANNFFLAVHAGVTAAVAALLPRPEASTAADRPLPLDSTLIALAGMALSLTWFLSLRSYRHLSRAKWNVIVELEKRLPVAVFGDEWNTLKKEPSAKRRDRYEELGEVERLVPTIFFALYVLSLAIAWCT